MEKATNATGDILLRLHDCWKPFLSRSNSAPLPRLRRGPARLGGFFGSPPDERLLEELARFGCESARIYLDGQEQDSPHWWQAILFLDTDGNLKDLILFAEPPPRKSGVSFEKTHD